LQEFTARLRKSLQKPAIEFRVLFVDDGSTDNSLEIIQDICQQNSNYGYIRLSRNFGKEIAMTAGIEFSSADALVIIDADLQDPPELIPDLLNCLKSSAADVVYAKRKRRRGEHWFKKLCASLFYKLFNSLNRFYFPRDTGDFRIMRRNVVEAAKKMRRKKSGLMKGPLWHGVGFQAGLGLSGY